MAEVAELRRQASKKPTSIQGMLQVYKGEIARALPRHMTADRLARVALTECRKTPALLNCKPESLFGAIIQAAQLGLEPGGALGHCYLIPFGREVQFIVGYRGMIDLARRSGQIVSIEAHAVYHGDQFECTFGLNSDLKHVPNWDDPDRAHPDRLTFVYAVAKLRDGGIQFEVMSRAEVDAIRARSKAGKSGPWVTDYTAMALKTVIRRMFKYLPVSIEMQTAVGLDEKAETSMDQDNWENVIVGESTVVDDDLSFDDGKPPQAQPQQDKPQPTKATREPAKAAPTESLKGEFSREPPEQSMPQQPLDKWMTALRNVETTAGLSRLLKEIREDSKLTKTERELLSAEIDQANIRLKAQTTTTENSTYGNDDDDPYSGFSDPA